MRKRIVADILAELIELEGVDVMFTVPGGTVVPLQQAVGRSGHLQIVVSKDEAGAAYAAQGYAAATGKPGVVLAVGGPGATNALTGLGCAAIEGTPVVLISGEVASSALGRRAAQDGSDLALDVLAMSRPVTALSAAVASPSKAAVTFTEAFRRAIHERRPVHLSVPLDVQTAAAEGARYTSVAEYRAERSEPVDGNAVARAVEELGRGGRMALLAGAGARGAEAELLQLAERLGSPVATSCGAKGVFPEDHPLSLGVFSFASGPLARAVLTGKLDLLVAIGTGLGEFATLNYSNELEPARRLIHMDVNPAVFGRNYSCLPVCGDSRAVLRQLLRALGRHQVGVPGWFEELRRQFPLLDNLPATTSDQAPMRPERVMTEIGRALPPNACVVSDIGTSCAWVAQYLKVKPPQRCFIPMGWSAMGHPLAASIGVRLGSRQPTVCVTGDAAFLSKGLELQAALENGVSQLVWVVLNNRGHALVRMGTEALLGPQHGVEAGDFKTVVDVAGIASALGAGARVVEDPLELPGLLSQALRAERPWVLDVRVDPDASPPVIGRIEQLSKSMQQKEGAS